jgi:hypothetical protein
MLNFLSNKYASPVIPIMNGLTNLYNYIAENEVAFDLGNPPLHAPKGVQAGDIKARVGVGASPAASFSFIPAHSAHSIYFLSFC